MQKFQVGYLFELSNASQVRGLQISPVVTYMGNVHE